ncbi:MAG: histidine kinase [Candidatus Altiarchaeales archaeon HGW-Altiarchaeales-1]|nr:MAG: histidine kinase [Candidatus Altiarchaeales archaeon HGW-Altiarchaeales-1]
MDAEKLKEIIRNGESSTVEFKETLTYKLPLEKEIVAFLNLRGGKILIGVSDDKDIVGIDEKELKDIEEKIMNKCRSVVKPEIIPIYETVFVDGKYVVVLEVRGIDKPYYVFKDDRKTYYIRVGTTEREATREELKRLFQASGMIHYEENPVFGSKPEDLDIKEIEKYFIEKRNIDTSKMNKYERTNILINAGILCNVEGEILCSVAGILLFGKEPAKFLPQSGMMFAHFDGNEISGKLTDRKELKGTLVKNIEEMVNIINLNLPEQSEIQGLKRVEKVLYPCDVIREAIVNACAHRDYTIFGSKIMVFLFNDRLEIKSPGKLPNSITIENIKIGRSVRRNHLIAQFLNDYRYMEKLGLGIRMIIREMKDLSGIEPDIKEEGEEFIIILYKKRENDENE